jgi:hypothetical protein
MKPVDKQGVMPGLDPGIHEAVLLAQLYGSLRGDSSWIAGPSPAEGLNERKRFDELRPAGGSSPQ